MSLKTDQIKNELIRYLSVNPTLFSGMVLSSEVCINQFARTVTKVKGHYPSVQALMSHAVQIFDSKKVTPYGDITFLYKDLKNFHQKVDFQIDPAEILGSIFEEKYEESKGLQQKSISVLAMQILKEKVIDDVNILSITGKFDASQKGLASPTFGSSMDGLNEVHKKIAADTTNPAFLIPGDAITKTNVLEVVTEYERQIPSLYKNKVKTIFMSQTDAEDYQIAYEDKFGQNKFQDDAMRTRLGKRQIVGIPNLTKGTIVSTVDNNLLRLIDEIDNPATITSVQENGRILDVLGEFSLGYDYAVNQLVFMHTSDGTKKRGLNNADQNELFYASEKLSV